MLSGQEELRGAVRVPSAEGALRGRQTSVQGLGILQEGGKIQIFTTFGEIFLIC